MRLRTSWGKRLRALTVTVGALALTQVTLGAGTADAAGIQCRDIGNGPLCSHMYWPNGDREWGWMDVWYDKWLGGPVEVVKIGFWRGGNPGYTAIDTSIVVGPGQRALHKFEVGPPLGAACWTPFIWVRPAGTNDTPVRLGGVQNCFGPA